MVESTRQVGQGGEAFVQAALERWGMREVRRNVDYGAYGQIDLVAYDHSALWAIEVKTRRHTSAYGGPLHALRPQQIQRIRRCLVRYARSVHWDGDLRIAVAAVAVDQGHYRLLGIHEVL